MTEEDANTKWCPFSRIPMYSPTSLASCNRGDVGHLPNSSLCIGSACMAWRDLADMKTEEGGKPNGYCGLAGAPP